MMDNVYTVENFHSICVELANKDDALKSIIDSYGLPPMWTRPAIFQTLILTILEQQVSLASAYAAYKRLKEKIGFVTPEKILALSDEELRACSFTRQKIVYARALAVAIVNKEINLDNLTKLTDDDIRTVLKRIKGIGDWTVDVYLMHALQRTDIFPLGDIALVNSLRHLKQLPLNTSKEEMLAIAESWRPYRTIASMMLWHAYIQRKGIKVLD
ncbi:MAG: DNA-3-methyladenine glycosylase 2 family protein [Bacteroidota bacterium]|nr:DNA-3-methyladenine glycosylase 2 family protein [Bacteroidota bacterium]